MGGSCSKPDPTLTKQNAFIVSDEGNFKEMTHIELARWLASKGFPEAGSHARSQKIRGARIYSLWQENKAAEIVSTLQLSEADESWGKLRLELEIILGSYQGADVAALPPHLQADLDRKKSRGARVSQSVKGGTAGGSDEVVILGPDGTLIKVSKGGKQVPRDMAEAPPAVEAAPAEAAAAPAQEGAAAETEAVPAQEAAAEAAAPEVAEAAPAAAQAEQAAAAAEPAQEAAEPPGEAAAEEPEQPSANE